MKKLKQDMQACMMIPHVNYWR